MPLPTDVNSTPNYTAAEHATHHNEIHTHVNSHSGSTVWTPYTPTLTATTTNPTLGSGSIATGRYAQNGKHVSVQVHIKFGTSGVAAGSGSYLVSLPVTAVSPLRSGGGVPIGMGSIVDAGTSKRGVWVNQFTTTTAYMEHTDTALVDVTHASPFTWAANDEIILSFTYEAA